MLPHPIQYTYVYFHLNIMYHNVASKGSAVVRRELGTDL
jgi:hypothetical protein